MNYVSLKKIVGLALMAFGTFGIALLLFFYTVILFSEKWPGLQSAHEMFRLLFTIPRGITVIYAAFVVVVVPLLAVVLLGARLFSGKKYVTKMQAFLLGAVWVSALSIGAIITIVQAQEIVGRVSPFSSNPVDFNVGNEIPLSVRDAFKAALKAEVNTNGIPVKGYEPFMFLESFPGLTATDFEGVEASIGYYTVEAGKLVHKNDDSKLIHSAAKAITDSGIDRLLANVSVRLKVDLTQGGTLTEVMEALVRYTRADAEESGGSSDDADTLPDANQGGGATACTMDAKICPDGSAVGRGGPNCTFADCPIVAVPESGVHVCTAEEKQMEACTMQYAPVCGQVQVQCIQAPCPPIPQTFGNACSACGAGNVISYTQGECRL